VRCTAQSTIGTGRGGIFQSRQLMRTATDVAPLETDPDELESGSQMGHSKVTRVYLRISGLLGGMLSLIATRSGLPRWLAAPVSPPCQWCRPTPRHEARITTGGVQAEGIVPRNPATGRPTTTGSRPSVGLERDQKAKLISKTGQDRMGGDPIRKSSTSPVLKGLPTDLPQSPPAPPGLESRSKTAPAAHASAHLLHQSSNSN
jgi:hypothetical protein